MNKPWFINKGGSPQRVTIFHTSMVPRIQQPFGVETSKVDITEKPRGLKDNLLGVMWYHMVLFMVYPLILGTIWDNIAHQSSSYIFCSVGLGFLAT